MNAPAEKDPFNDLLKNADEPAPGTPAENLYTDINS